MSVEALDFGYPLARLALLLPSLSNGGAERVTLSLAEDFLANGHEVDLVLALGHGELASQLPGDAKVFALRAPRLRSTLMPLIRYLRKRRPFALHAPMWPLTTISIIAGRLSGVRPHIVVSDHTILSKQFGESRNAMVALRWTTKLLYPLADARVCVSRACASDLSSLSGLPKRLFTTIHNPVLRPPSSPYTREAADQLWSDAEPRLLSVGMLKPAKNHELLIRAFAIFAKGTSARLIILGEGELRPQLTDLINELGLEGRVFLPGFICDPWPYYVSADLFVLSSVREGFGNALVEAMLAGLPVVSTDCDGPREILDDGRFGRLAPLGSAGELAKSIAEALDERHNPSAVRDRAIHLSANSTHRYLQLMLHGH